MVGRFRKNDDDKRPDPPKRSSSRPPKDDDKDQGRRLPFGGRDKADDKDSSGSSRRFPLPGGRDDADDKGRRMPFGSGRGDDRDKADDSGGGRRMPFGGSDRDKKADDSGGGRRMPFGGGRGEDKDKPAQPKGLVPKTPSRTPSATRRSDDKDDKDKRSSSGLGRFMPGRKGKDEEKPEPQRSPFLRSADDEPGSRVPGKSSKAPPSGGGPFGERRPSTPDRTSRPGGFGGSRTEQDEDRPGPARPSGSGDRPGGFSRSSPGDRSEPGSPARPGGTGDRPGGFSRSSPGDRPEPGSPARPGGIGDRPGGFSRSSPGDRPEPGSPARPGGIGDRPGGFSRSSPGDRPEPGSPARPGGLGDRPGGFSRSTPGDREETSRPGGIGDRPGGFSRPSPGDRSETSSPFGSRSPSRAPIGADNDDDEDDGGPPARPSGFGSRGIGDRPDADSPPRSASRPSPFGTPRQGSQSGTLGTGTRPPIGGDRPGGFSRPGAPEKEEPKKEEGRKSRLPSLIPGRGSKPAEPEKPSRTSGFGREAPGKTPPVPSRSASAAIGTATRTPAPSPAKPAPKPAPGKKAAPAKKPEKTPAPTRGRTQAAPLPQKKNAPQLVRGGLDLDRKLDLIGVALVMFGGIMFFGVIPSMSFGVLPPVEGGLTGTIDNALSTLFGWGKIIWPLLFLAIGLWLMLRYFGGHMFDVAYFRVVGALILYACVLTWIHMLQLIDDPAPTVEAFRPISEALATDKGQGGGYLGHKFYFTLLSQLGDWGTLVSLIGWLVLGLMLTFDVSVVELGQFVASIFAVVGIGRGDRALKRAAKEAATAEAVPVQRPGETPPALAPKQIPLAPSAVATVTTAATVAAAAVLSTAEKPTEAGRSMPFIRRRGDQPETAEAVNEAAPPVRPTVQPATPEKTEDETLQPARRRLPHLRRAAPDAPQEAPLGKKSEPAPVSEESTHSGGRLGFLRRNKGTETPEKPSAAEASPEATKPETPPVAPMPVARAETPEVQPAPPNPADLGRREVPLGPRRTLEPPMHSSEQPPSRDVPVRPTGEMPARPSPFARSLPGSRQPMSTEPLSDNPAEKPTEAAAPERPIERPMTPPVRDRAQALGLPQRPGTPPARPAFGRPDDKAEEEAKTVDKAEEKIDIQAGTQEQVEESKPADPVPAVVSAELPAPTQPERAESKPDEPVDPPARPAFKFGLPRSSAPQTPEQPEPKAEMTTAVEPPKAEVTPPGADPVPDEKPAVPIGLVPRAAPPPRVMIPKLDKDDDDIDEEIDELEDEIDLDDEEDDEDDTVKAETPARPALTPQRTIPTMRPAPPPPQAGQITTPPPARREEEPVRPSVRPPTNVPLGKTAEPAAAVARGTNAPQAKATPHTGGGYELPDFHQILRQGGEQHINDEILLDKARIIEDTLASFGAPGKVVEVNPGPVITQFGIEPDYLLGRGGKKMRVKVGSIARLDADLALALAAKSIRIEAPVPGKGFVGIEVPNDETTLVGLYDIMDAPQFAKVNSKLRLALGLSVDGTPVAADLAAMPHLLIAGTTGSGKSVCVNSIIACLLLSNTPEDVQFIMVDPKRVELTGYNGIPHLVAPVVVELERIVGVLQWVQREMEERYRKFAAVGARNILDYNGKLNPGERKMPYYVVIVDELADLMMLAPDETERLLARLAQMARATGIHLIISTQRPSVDIITGLIKANFPARIAFAVASSVDSRVILDQPGAEKLLGRGDMLFQSPDAAAPVRMQGVFLSDEEINRITRYWKGLVLEEAGAEGRATLASPSRAITFNAAPLNPGGNRSTAASPKSGNEPAQRAFWDDTGSVSLSNGHDDEDVSGEDELYDEAVDLVMRLNKASISLLQRRLRIGYTRAARLIDIMEQDGIVGPAESGSKPREVLKTSRD